METSVVLELILGSSEKTSLIVQNMFEILNILSRFLELFGFGKNLFLFQPLECDGLKF